MEKNNLRVKSRPILSLERHKPYVFIASDQEVLTTAAGSALPHCLTLNTGTSLEDCLKILALVLFYWQNWLIKTYLSNPWAK